MSFSETVQDRFSNQWFGELAYAVANGPHLDHSDESAGLRSLVAQR